MTENHQYQEKFIVWELTNNILIEIYLKNIEVKKIPDQQIRS